MWLYSKISKVVKTVGKNDLYCITTEQHYFDNVSSANDFVEISNVT